MRYSVKILCLLSFSWLHAGVFCSEEFTVDIPFGEDIPYTPLDIDLISYDIRKLYRGIPVETFDEVIVEEMMNSSKSCAMISKFTHGSYEFTPAMCTNSCDAIGAFPDSLGIDCAKRFGHKFRGVCCSASDITFYNNFPNEDLHQKEPPHQFHGPRFNVDWEKVQVESFEQPIDDLYNVKQFVEELRKERVCGIKRTAEHDYTIFICVHINNCLAPTERYESDPYIARPTWEMFCNQHLDTEAETVANTFRCCHTNYLPDYHFHRKYTNLRFRQIPVSLTYAPGLRSSFMCEAYSWRFLCGKDSKKDECVPPPEYSAPRPSNMTDALYLKDAPYIARLGVVARHIIIFHCLGAVISHRFILSAWECRRKHGIPTNIVVLGEDDTDGRFEDGVKRHSQVYSIYKIFPYQHHYQKQDIPIYQPTLYRTGKDMEFSPRIRPACLFYKSMDTPAQADLPYFGKLRDDYWMGRFLRKQVMDIHPPDHQRFIDICEPSQNYILDYLNPQYREEGVNKLHPIFCGGKGLGHGEENGPCKYDRGSPLVTKLVQPYCSWQILGVLTTERWNSRQDTPLVFTNITRWLGHLEDIVWPHPFLELNFPKRSCPFPENYTLPSPRDALWQDFWVNGF